MLVTLNRCTDKFLKFILGICCLYVVIIAVTCVLQVFGRYVLNSSFPWTEEAARFAWMSLGMLGLPVALRRKAHIAIDFLPNRLKKGSYTIYRVHQAIVFVLVLFTSISFTYAGFNYLIALWGTKGTAMPFFPMELIHLTIPVGAALCVWVSFLELLNVLTSKNKAPVRKEA